MIKQVIIMRTSYTNSQGNPFSLRKGKLIAQGAHASTSFFAAKFFNNGQISSNCQTTLTDIEQKWLDNGMTKICLQVQTEQELMDIIDKASKAGLTHYAIVDRGTTEFNGVPTLTCVAIGPDEEEKIDKITGDLKLY